MEVSGMVLDDYTIGQNMIPCFVITNFDSYPPSKFQSLYTRNQMKVTLYS